MIKDDNKCWSRPLGYECCETCSYVVLTDDDGNWGVNASGYWCGIPESCN